MSEVETRDHWVWPAFSVAVLVATGVRVAYAQAHPVALGLLACLGVLYFAVGRPLIRRCADDSLAGAAYLAVITAVEATAALLAPSASWALFMLVPQAFMLLSVRFSIPAALIMNSIPLLAFGFASHQWTQTLMMALLSIVVGYWLTRVIKESRERAALIAELRASEEQVARLAGQAGALAERERLAGEIHDTLAQGFTSIVTLLQAAESRLERDPDTARRHIELATRTARENLAEARILVAAGTPSALESATLLDAVRRQADRFTEEAGVAASFVSEGEPRRLQAHAEVILLRAAQELLANVRRHTESSAVRVRLGFADDTVSLQVCDDGAGFDGTEGFGLRGLRARVERLGGTVRIHSSPGTGTAVTVEVPA